MKTGDEPRFLCAGDRALVVEFGQEIDEGINQKVYDLACALKEHRIEGIGETIPTFRSLLVYYDRNRISVDKVKAFLNQILGEMKEKSQSALRIWRIPCCYSTRFGKDLHDLEKYTGLSKEEIISLHSSAKYRIYMMGFLPGFAYLGGMNSRLSMPRLSTPRTRIPAGSVGIAGGQTGIYPLDSPGGWRLIGETPMRMYDPGREDPILCRAGDYIQFFPIGIDEYYDIRHAVIKGEYEPEMEVQKIS